MSEDFNFATAFFPGLELYGAEWLEEIKTNTTKQVFIVERHHGEKAGRALQKEMGRETLVIAINNPARAKSGCSKCPKNWHGEIENQGRRRLWR
ncbi:MAG: hypothetical protein GY769_08120 [bacterium]|nr:hypothetical protein [bacterium]